MAGEIPKQGVVVEDVAKARDLAVGQKLPNPDGYGVTVNEEGELVIKPYTHATSSTAQNKS